MVRRRRRRAKRPDHFTTDTFGDRDTAGSPLGFLIMTGVLLLKIENSQNRLNLKKRNLKIIKIKK